MSRLNGPTGVKRGGSFSSWFVLFSTRVPLAGGLMLWCLGGHGGLKRISDEPGVITKVGRGTEIEFYQRVQLPQQDAVPPTILSFIPKFYGLLEAFPRGT